MPEPLSGEWSGEESVGVSPQKAISGAVHRQSDGSILEDKILPVVLIEVITPPRAHGKPRGPQRYILTQLNY
jgi:hypothetical protein